MGETQLCEKIISTNSAVRLKDKGHSFVDARIHTLDWGDGWFERRAKRAVSVPWVTQTHSHLQMQTWDPFSSISTPTRNLCQVTSIVYVIWFLSFPGIMGKTWLQKTKPKQCSSIGTQPSWLWLVHSNSNCNILIYVRFQPQTLSVIFGSLTDFLKVSYSVAPEWTLS